MSTFYDGNGNVITIEGGDVPTSVNELLSFQSWPEYNGYITRSNKWDKVSLGTYKVRVIPVNGGEKLSIAGWKNGKVSVTTNFSEPVQDAAAPTLATGMSYNALFWTLNGITLPSDARFLIIQTLYNSSDWSPYLLKLDGTDYMISVRDEVANEHYRNGVNWMQFGDSITWGYISYWCDKTNDIAASASNQFDLVWPYLVSKLNNWSYTRNGQGGQGWICGGSPAYSYVRGVDDYSPYNFITFAFGINDWKGVPASSFGSISDSYTYSDDMTPSTVVESMRFCFDYILRRNTRIKIMVISPFNCRGYKSEGTHPYGTWETCWARGYNRQGVTLDDFADLMQSVCDEYGIEMIDMTRNSVINRDNLIDLLPDGVHPSVECHRLLAREMSKKFNFNIGGTTEWRKDYHGGLVVSDSIQSISMEVGTTATVSVALDTKPENKVSVTAMVNANERTELKSVPEYKVFTPTDYAAPQSFTLTAYKAGSYMMYIVVPEANPDVVVEIPVTVTNSEA